MFYIDLSLKFGSLIDHRAAVTIALCWNFAQLFEIMLKWYFLPFLKGWRYGRWKLPCDRVSGWRFIWKSVQRKAQVHRPGFLRNFWYYLRYSFVVFLLFIFLFILKLQTVAMKFIPKHGKSEKDILNLRQEIEVPFMI